jgi:hypothetical protein
MFRQDIFSTISFQVLQVMLLLAYCSLSPHPTLQQGQQLYKTENKNAVCTRINQHGVARRIFFLKFVLWCGNIENCRKIDHIFSATYQNLRPEEMRSFGISSPKSRNQQRPRKLPKAIHGQRDFPSLSTSHFAVIRIPHTARYALVCQLPA